MKHRSLLACLLIITTCCLSSCKLRPMPGSYSKTSVYTAEVISAADFAIQAQAKTLQSLVGEAPTQLNLVKIVKANQQVVAGMNYRLTLLVNENGAQRTAEAVVWWQEWREPMPYQLMSWQWSDE